MFLILNVFRLDGWAQALMREDRHEWKPDAFDPGKGGWEVVCPHMYCFVLNKT